MNRLYPIQEWSKFRTGVGSENGDRQLTTTNKNWAQRNDNRKRTTSGNLKIGTKYTLQDWITDDDFSNAGGTNEDGHIFVATRTGAAAVATPTKWSNSSVLEEWGTERGRLIPCNAENVFLAFMAAHASDPNNGTASINIYMYRRNGPAQLVGDYDLVCGDLDVVRYPYPPYEGVLKKNYIDTIRRVDSAWIDGPKVVGGDGNDEIAMLRIPTHGYEWILVEVDAVSSGITLDVLMSSSNQLLETTEQDDIKEVAFPQVSWATGAGNGAKPTTIYDVNMMLERVDVLISAVTANPTVNITFADDNGVVPIDATNFTTLADGTNHMMLSTKATADFDAVPITGNITATITPSADAGGSAQLLTVQIIFRGP